MDAPDCPHWRDCGIKSGGCCAIEKYQRPSRGTCAVCLGQPIPLTIRRALHGAKQLAKAAMGLGQADEATIGQRRAICGECKHAKKDEAGGLVGCEVCTCRLLAKTSLAEEECPIGKWGAAQ